MLVRRTLPEFRYHLEQALECIEINVEAFKEGKFGAWLAVAAQLNVLLCDAIPVLFMQRVIPDFSLHPLARDSAKVGHGYLLDVTGTHHLFDYSKPRIPLHQWLDQTLAVLPAEDSGVPIRLGELIASSRNKLGPGHFVPSLEVEKDEEKRAMATLAFRVFNGKEMRPFHEEYLVAIGEYIVGQIREQYKDTYEGQVFIEDRMCTIKGDQALGYQIDTTVDFSKGILLHAVVLLSKHAMRFRRTLFDIASVDDSTELRVWLDERDRIRSTLYDASGKPFSLKPIPYEYFDRLAVVVCSLSPILDETSMEFMLSLNGQIVSRYTIRPSIGGPVAIRPSVGATVDGKENARMKVGDLGIGAGLTGEEDHCLLAQSIVEKWSIA